MSDIQEKILELMDLFDEDEVTTADKINRPEPKQSVKEIELFNDFNIRNPKAGGGMLVQPSADGSRPGYSKERITEESFKKEYNNYLKNNKFPPTDKQFAEVLNKNYTTRKKDSPTFNVKNVQRARKRYGIETFNYGDRLSPEARARVEKVRKEIVRLVNKYNAGEKFVGNNFISKLIIDKFGSQGLPQGRIDIRNYPEILNLESRSEKIDKTLKNMLIEETPLKGSWYDAIQNKTGISQDTIGDYLKKSQTYNVIKDQGADYLKTMRFSGKNVSAEVAVLKNMSFSDQLTYALEIKEGKPFYVNLGRSKKYSLNPASRIMEFALRSWNANRGSDDSPVQFFDKNGKKIDWKFGTRLPFKQVSFSYNGKMHKSSDLNTKYMKQYFPNVYENVTAMNNLATTKVDNPLKKGEKIFFKDLVKKNQVENYKWSPTTSTLDVLHGPKGVKFEPFTNLNFNTRDINQVEQGVSRSTKLTQSNKNIILKAINELAGTGDTDAIIRRQQKLTKNPVDYQTVKNNFLKNLTDKKFGRVADVIVKASKEGGFGDIMQKYCMRKKAKKGGRMFFAEGPGCPAARENPKDFLKTISEDPKIARFLKSGSGQKAASLAARVTGNVLNPSTLIGGEVAFVIGDGLNNFASGLDLAESFDRAFIFSDFGKFEKNIINKAKEIGYDDNQLNLLQQTINLNKLDNKIRKLKFGLNVEKSDPSGLTSDATMGFENSLVNADKQLKQSADNYLKTLDNMGLDINKATDQETGFRYVDNIFKKRTQDQLIKTFDKRKRQVDPTQTPFGDFISPVFDLGSYTQPLKFAADIFNPFTKDVPFLSERQQEAKKLREMSEEELDAYNKARGFTLENIQQGTAPQIRPLMDYLGTDVTGQGFGTQFLAGGGIAKLAGVDQGPPPESGPNSQGLSGLFKRVKRT
jgi:hypothetical protein